jgi:hypothetical protein
MTTKPSGGGGFVVSTLLLSLPSLFALFSSMQVANGGVGTSALWFIYQVSESIGIVGIIVGAVLTIIKATDGTISRLYVGLMACSVVLSIFLLWYAFHIFRSPWF